MTMSGNHGLLRKCLTNKNLTYRTPPKLSRRYDMETVTKLQWCHNEHVGVSNRQPHDCLLNRLFKAQIKENIKAPRHWPLCGEIAGDRWIPRTNGQLRGKCFHLMTSSWHCWSQAAGDLWLSCYITVMVHTDSLHFVVFCCHLVPVILSISISLYSHLMIAPFPVM